MRGVMFLAWMCIGGLLVAGDLPIVSDVTLAETAGGRAVVGYTISEPAVTTFQFKTNGVDIIHSEVELAVSGNVGVSLSAGNHQFKWDARLAFPEQILSNLTVEVKAWPTNNPPLYCEVVMNTMPYKVRWYATAEEVVGGIDNLRFKRESMLMRKIPSSQGRSVVLGATVNEYSYNADELLRTVRITQPFYMGIYQVTQRQWQLVRGNRPSVFSHEDYWQERPVEQVSWAIIRMASEHTVNAAYDWPTKGHEVHPSSFMGTLRANANNQLQFDLPTEAQWEYACRAGVTTSLNNGFDCTDNDDQNMNLLGRNSKNGGYVNGVDPKAITGKEASCDTSIGTAAVGSYLPNAWGLYDMHGNVREWCLDWYSANDFSMSVGDDPKGLNTGTARVSRGGGWNQDARYGRCAYRNSDAPTTKTRPCGFRVAAAGVVLATP